MVLATSCSSAVDGSAGTTAHVRLDQGELIGIEDAGIVRYQGIPYAAPPVRELRWAPPRPAAGWAGPRYATEPGPRCAQLPSFPGTLHTTAGSDREDCLTVNVTVPADTAATARLPVLVWIHGGGFSAGAGNDVDPRRLVEAGPMIVVTMNYRLGILGFLGLPGLPGSGAFGLLDQQEALRWVQRDIDAFGGDPGRVTVAGGSAGADSICAQLVSPASLGLFHRAVLQSSSCGTANITDVIRPGSGAGGDTWKPLPVVEAAGANTAAALGCGDPATAPACLRARPAGQLLRTAAHYWSPATGSPTVPHRPSDLMADRGRELRPVQLLIGTNHDEGTLFTTAFFDRDGDALTEDGVRALLAAAAGTRASAAGRAYLPGDRSPGRAWSDVITDRAYACPGLATYRALWPRAALYAYEFADPSAPAPFVTLPPDLAGSVTHGSEMAYLFDLVPGQPELTAPQQALSAELVGAWARFVVTGDPGGSLPWPRWDGDGQLLSFTTAGPGTTVRTGTEFAEAHHCALWS